MDKELLDITNDLSNKPTTELALQIMELVSENLILEQQCKKQKEAIDKIIEIINYYGVDKEYNDNVILRHILKDMLDILKEVSE